MMKYYTSVLTKKTYAQSPQHESENYAGCMPSLFRLFDFRRNPKLISNRNYNIRHPVVVDANAKHFNGDLHEGVDKEAHVQSVKTLMEEEMTKLIPSSMISTDKIENQIQKDGNIERNSILMIPPSPASFNFTNPIENSDLESNLSSRELYFKLLEDSNSTVFEKISDPDQNLSWRREKEKPNNNNNNNNNNSEGYSRIVILKPSLSRITSPINSDYSSERNLHHFSIREIKRRLRHTIIESKKERDLISIVSNDSIGDLKTLSTNEDTKISTIEDKNIINGEDKMERSMNNFSYEEARKHLMERLESVEMKKEFEIGNERKALKCLISFPDFDSLSSPICTPKKEDEDDLFSSPICTPKKEEDTDDLDLVDRGFPKFKFSETIREENSMDVLSPNITTNESSDILDLFGEIQAEKNNDSDESLDLSEEGSQNEAESLHYSEEEMSPNYPEILENEKSSVLVDITRSPSRIAKYEELPIQRTIIKFREPEIYPSLDPEPNFTVLNDKIIRSEFISAVIKASGLCNLQNSERWRETESPLLDPFIYDEIGVSYDYTEESKILFDLIEEVLFEIENKYFIFTPWMKLISHEITRVPFGETLILEVCKQVDLYLALRFPCTLDQVVKKDLDIGPNWDVRPDMEISVLDVGDEILDDLLEEMVFDLWF